MGNLQELKTEAIETLTINIGRRSAERTRAGDVISREQRVKDRPSITLNLDPSTGANMSLAIAALGPESDKAFDLQLRAGIAGTAGFRVTGIGLINDTGLTEDAVTSNVSLAIEIVPVGSIWTFSGVVEAA